MSLEVVSKFSKGVSRLSIVASVLFAEFVFVIFLLLFSDSVLKFSLVFSEMFLLFSEDIQLVLHVEQALSLSRYKILSQEVLEFAASLAAFYSKLSNASKVEIDFTEVRNVKKIPGAKPGMVIYENYKTMYIEPNDGSSFLIQQ